MAQQIDELTVQINCEICEHIMATKTKRPPLAWNVNEQGPMPTKYGLVAVFLNQIEQKRCVAYDVEKGFIIRYKSDKNGNPIVKNDKLLTEKLTGSVLVKRMN